jgi:release factor glutamine methyltransferase
MPSVLQIIQSTTEYFTRHGVENPRLNAEHLLAHTLGKNTRLDLYLEFDRPVGEHELAAMRELVRKRAQGIPLQHLLGTVVFFGREFSCDSRALVPRPETEQLVELALKSKIQNPKSKILDVGSGSGVIAVTLALELPTAILHATDISPGALALARENADRHGVSSHITFHEADLFPPGDVRFDLIVANLPYVSTDDLATLQREVKHDPPSALDGGPDGLDLIRRLLTDAPQRQRLSPGGAICLEIGHDQSPAVMALFSTPQWRDPRTEKDLQGVERFIMANSAA